jgi:hypothetical protein
MSQLQDNRSSQTTHPEIIPYASFQDFIRLCEGVHGSHDGVVLFIDVQLATFDEITQGLRDRDDEDILIFLYLEKFGYLYITFPTVLNQTLHHTLYNVVFAQMYQQQGLWGGWDNVHPYELRCLVNGNIIFGGGKSSCWTPADSSLDWPTLVVEPGVQDSNARTRKAGLWFQASNHQVQIVLVVGLDLANSRIVIERWESSRRELGHVMAHVESVTIDRRPDLAYLNLPASDPSLYTASGPLSLATSKLLPTRPPAVGEQIIISVEMLRQYAAAVWGCVFRPSTGGQRTS